MAFILNVIRFYVNFQRQLQRVPTIIPGKGFLGVNRFLPIFFVVGAILQFKAYRLADEEEIEFSKFKLLLNIIPLCLKMQDSRLHSN